MLEFLSLCFYEMPVFDQTSMEVNFCIKQKKSHLAFRLRVFLRENGNTFITIGCTGLFRVFFYLRICFPFFVVVCYFNYKF